MLALQALYESDCVGHSPEQTLSRIIEEARLPEEAADFATRLVLGVTENKERLDSIIRTTAPIWPVEQMALIDRNILRLAIYELVIAGEVPLKAAINEAVELAKAFGSDSSPRFINGVLGTVSAQWLLAQSRPERR